MSAVTTHYVTWTRGRHRRHSGASAIDIVPALTTIGSSQYQAFAPPQISWTDASGARTAYFAFWSATGLTDGPIAQTNSTLNVAVGTTDITAKAFKATPLKDGLAG